jgi:hypothetical protein
MIGVRLGFYTHAFIKTRVKNNLVFRLPPYDHLNPADFWLADAS